MGQCLSFVLGRGPGKKKATYVSKRKGSTEGTKSFSVTSRSTTVFSSRCGNQRNSAGQRLSNATDEYDAEAASGFFSMSDFSTASAGYPDVVATGQHRTFGRLIAQEAMNEATRQSTDLLLSPKHSPSVSMDSPWKASEASHRNNFSVDRQQGEITPVVSASVVDAMNVKGRRSLEKLRQLTTGDPQNLQKSSSWSHKRRQSKDTLGPVDFDFLVQKASADNSKIHSPGRRDVKRSAPPDQVNGSESAHVSSSSAKDINDISKSYKKSAAKAAARDRDAFKYKSSSDNDFSVTSSVGASPAAKPRRIRHKRSGSNHSVPDEEVTETSSSQTSLEQIRASRRRKAATSPIPMGLVRNNYSPSIPEGAHSVEAKPVVGLLRIRSSPGSLHLAATIAGLKFDEEPLV